LENEIHLLRGLLKKDVDLAQKKNINVDAEVDNLENNQDANYDPAGQLEGNLGELRKFIKNIESEQDNKKRLMGNMNTLLKEMLKG
jgi:peptidoglycan hydrolase CwlO-like protein